MPRISALEFERLPLRVHAFLAGVPLHDVWAVDLPRIRTEDTWLIAAEIIRKNQIQGLPSFGLVFVVPARVVPFATADNLVGRQAEQEKILLACFSGHLNRRAVARADC